MLEECAICDKLQQIRFYIHQLDTSINLFDSTSPKTKRTEFGISLNTVMGLDKQIIKVIALHDQYHMNLDQPKNRIDPFSNKKDKKK